MILEDLSTTCYIHLTLCFCNFSVRSFRITLSSSVKNPPAILLEFQWFHLRADWHSYALEHNICLNLFRSFSFIFLHKVLVHLFFNLFIDNFAFYCVLFKVTFCYTCSCWDCTCFFPTTLLNSSYSNIDILTARYIPAVMLIFFKIQHRDTWSSFI